MTRLGSGSNAGPRHRIFTWSEVGKSADAYQNTLSSSQVCKIAASGIHPAYIVIDNKVYDLAIHGDHFFRWHPGAFVPLACVGRDATSAVEAFHGRNSDASSFMETYYVGDLELPVTKSELDVLL
jgi:cytochrome b involved in lipid metabolism